MRNCEVVEAVLDDKELESMVVELVGDSAVE